MNKWQEKTIKSLMNRGYDPLSASKLYEKAYKRLGKVLSPEFNREYEAYMSLASSKNVISFDIKNDRLYISKTGEDVSTETFSKAITLNRVSNLAAKYLEVDDLVESYLRGDITLDDLNKGIAEFKKHNAEYQKAGSD